MRSRGAGGGGCLNYSFLLVVSCASTFIIFVLVAYAQKSLLTLYLIETPFNVFASGSSLVRAALSGSTLFAYGSMIYLTLH